MPLNQHINQRTTNNIRLTAYEYILAIQIVTDGVKNLHNSQWSAGLKWRCSIKTIDINYIWNNDILRIDMFGQWQLNNDAICFFINTILQYHFI